MKQINVNGYDYYILTNKQDYEKVSRGVWSGKGIYRISNGNSIKITDDKEISILLSNIRNNIDTLMQFISEVNRVLF